MAEREHVVAHPAAVRVVDGDGEIGVVIEQPADDVHRLPGGGGEELDVERREAEVSVERDRRRAAVASVDRADRFARTADEEVLPVRARDQA